AQRRKLEGRGVELHERGECPFYVLVRFATAAREPRVPTAGGSGGVCGMRSGRREPAARRLQLQRNGGDRGGHPAADHQAAEPE
ncbi:Hypothetical predicted protein, partial [Marmota monax]